MSDAAVALLQAPARGIEDKVRKVSLGTSALRQLLARVDRYQYRDLIGLTLNNLANALRELPARDGEERAQNVREAVGYYKDALTVRTKDRYPHLYAQTIANLGMCLLSSKETSVARSYLEEALALREFLPDLGAGIEQMLKEGTSPPEEKTPEKHR